jgi:hypothetical protein
VRSACCGCWSVRNGAVAHVRQKVGNRWEHLVLFVRPASDSFCAGTLQHPLNKYVWDTANSWIAEWPSALMATEGAAPMAGIPDRDK